MAEKLRAAVGVALVEVLGDSLLNLLLSWIDAVSANIVSDKRK